MSSRSRKGNKYEDMILRLDIRRVLTRRMEEVARAGEVATGEIVKAVDEMFTVFEKHCPRDVSYVPGKEFARGGIESPPKRSNP